MRERLKKKSRESNLRIDFQFSWGTFNLNSFENELTVFTKKKQKEKKKKKKNRDETRRKKGKEKKREKLFI